MIRIPSALAIATALLAATPAAAQPVQVTSLAAPDAFSVPGRNTGLGADLWRGASLETLRTVLPLLAAKPLSPAAAQLARRVLATGARGPEGADAEFLGLRAQALLALGDVTAANAILQRAPGLERSAELSRAAAESALLAGDDARACAVEEGLGVGREGAYWLRLRTFCQLLAGQAAQAQLTFDLAQSQAKDPVFARLMAAKLNGAAGGGASLRNGLDYALSKSLSLDLTKASPSPAVAVAIRGGDIAPPTWDLATLGADVGGLAAAAAAGETLSPDGLSALIAAAEADAKSRTRLQSAALLLAALAPSLTPADRSRLAGFTVPEGKAPAARSLALADAAGRKLQGETAMLALWTATEAGAAGPGIADRARLVHALAQAGLEADARAFAVEGLAGLK